MSYVLRHRPDKAGISLDAQGWIGAVDLAEALSAVGPPVSLAQIEHVVATSDKQRFELVDGRIRAAQGHSIQVDLDLPTATPPAKLYHGTVQRFLPSIRSQGLKPGTRRHVHLSPDRETATRVGSRRGEPVILVIDAARMAADGYDFYRSSNGVWLTDSVPVKYLVA